MAQRRHGATAGHGVLTRIGQAVMLHRGGDREEARKRMTALWQELGPCADAYQRCTLAHYLADTQDSPLEELRWDLRALSVAQSSRGHSDAGRTELRALLPALHLDLAADYARLARHSEARWELGRARTALDALEDDPHRQGIRADIECLQRRLDRAGGHRS
ncbi:hypothetical protein [Streptomyces violens]|uniref:hypothetical protein n=1 Tax=Streptomyces violens TaxID=66377 RepID=UPI0004BFD5B4|nr:hypothetical protein [Streptomyces violens]